MFAVMLYDVAKDDRQEVFLTLHRQRTILFLAQVSYCHSAASVHYFFSHFRLLQNRLMEFDETL